jgi:hypothetical protein
MARRFRAGRYAAHLPRDKIILAAHAPTVAIVVSGGTTSMRSMWSLQLGWVSLPDACDLFMLDSMRSGGNNASKHRRAKIVTSIREDTMDREIDGTE